MRGSSVSAVRSRVQVECRAAALLSCAHAPLARQLLPCYCPLNLTRRRSRHGASPVSRSDCGFAARTCTTRVLYLAVSAPAMYCNTQYARRHHQADHMISRQHVCRSSIAMVRLSCTYQAASRLPRAPTCHPSTRTAAPTPCTPCTRASCRQRRNGMNCRRGSRYLREAAPLDTIMNFGSPRAKSKTSGTRPTVRFVIILYTSGPARRGDYFRSSYSFWCCFGITKVSVHVLYRVHR